MAKSQGIPMRSSWTATKKRKNGEKQILVLRGDDCDRRKPKKTKENYEKQRKLLTRKNDFITPVYEAIQEQNDKN